MYSAIIIDDEKMSRDIISGYLKENCKDFSVNGCFPSGETALEFLKDNPVDVVITDIKMPGLSGLDFIKEIKAQNYDCYIVIISGYGRFEYAKVALQCQVENYILKPVDVKELVMTLNKIKIKLDTRKDTEFLDMVALYNEKKEAYLLDLIQGVFKSRDEIEENFYALEFNIDFEKTSGYLFIVKITDFDKYVVENWRYGKDSVYNAFLNIFRTNFKLKNIYMIKNTDIQFFFIGFTSDNAELMNKKEIETLFKKILKVQIDIIKEVRFKNICDLPNYVKDFLNIDNSVSILFSHIMNGDEKEAVALFETICKDKKDFYEYVLDNIYHRLNELNIPISKLEFFSDYEKAVTYLIKNISRQTKKEDYIIKTAIVYIQNNYQNDISREDVANEVFLEPTYFSKYFKNKTGETFHNYLFNFRMNKAIEFLQTNKSVTEVSHMVGYGDLVYFNKKFKQYTGLSPSDYKKQFGKEN